MFVLVPVVLGLILLGFAMAGAARDDRSGGPLYAWRLALAVGAGLGAAVFVVLWADRDDTVSTGDLILGLIAGPIAIALVPALFYFWLGRVFAGRPEAVLIASLVCFFPVAAYMFYAFLVTLEFTACGPDAYECPV